LARNQKRRDERGLSVKDTLSEMEEQHRADRAAGYVCFVLFVFVVFVVFVLFVDDGFMHRRVATSTSQSSNQGGPGS
jgi:ABC-type Fe3+ transport system permease subunit